MRHTYLIGASIAVGAVAIAAIGLLSSGEAARGPAPSQARSQLTAQPVARIAARSPTLAEELVQGTNVDPSSVVEEGSFVTQEGEARRVFTGTGSDGTCLIVRNGSSPSDGGYTCGRNLFETDPALLLEAFSADPGGAVTRYELTALLGPLASSISVVDSLGRSQSADVKGRVAFYALSPGDIALHVRVASVEVYARDGRLLASRPIAPVP